MAMATLLSKGNAICKAIKENKDTSKGLQRQSWKSKKRENKVNAQVARDTWTRLHHLVLS